MSNFGARNGAEHGSHDFKGLLRHPFRLWSRLHPVDLHGDFLEAWLRGIIFQLCFDVNKLHAHI